jgi:hypothetical protein
MVVDSVILALELGCAGGFRPPTVTTQFGASQVSKSKNSKASVTDRVGVDIRSNTTRILITESIDSKLLRGWWIFVRRIGAPSMLSDSH